MILFGQIPGADQAIKAATAESWVAVLLVVIVLATFCTFGYVIRHILKEASEREQRLAARINELENFMRQDLLSAVKDNALIGEKMLAACAAVCDAANDMSDAINHCRLSAAPRERIPDGR